MTDEALARQLDTQSRIHDAIFGKTERKRLTTSATAELTNWERCPVCDSPQIEGGNVQIDGTEAWQPVSCLNCEASWTEVYVADMRINIEGETS